LSAKRLKKARPSKICFIQPLAATDLFRIRSIRKPSMLNKLSRSIYEFNIDANIYFLRSRRRSRLRRLCIVKNGMIAAKTAVATALAA
jgi:hypothetical protein